MKFNWKEDCIRAFILTGIFTLIFTLWQALDLFIPDRFVDVLFMCGLTYAIYYIVYKKRSE